jgi:hypothetical protein
MEGVVRLGLVVCIAPVGSESKHVGLEVYTIVDMTSRRFSLIGEASSGGNFAQLHGGRHPHIYSADGRRSGTSHRSWPSSIPITSALNNHTEQIIELLRGHEYTWQAINLSINTFSMVPTYWRHRVKCGITPRLRKNMSTSSI